MTEPQQQQQQQPLHHRLSFRDDDLPTAKTGRQRLNNPNSRWIVFILVFSNLLVFQLGYLARYHTSNAHQLQPPLQNDGQPDLGVTPYYKHLYDNPLAIPRGIVPALPSIQSTSNNNIQRKNYGGVGDKVHLGGFIDLDLGGISPATWKYMVQTLGIHSIMDVGCGRGISTTWFITHGLDAICVEGSGDARQRSMLPDPATQMVQHDYARGPWWPAHKTYDAVWCVEFIEHVGRNYHAHYLPTFRKAALIFVTHSLWGGWHHVEVHKSDWWMLKFQSYGFIYSPELTERIRDVATQERKDRITSPNGKSYGASHIFLNMQVFINPMVASLPQHAHLFAEPGCFKAYGKGKAGNIDPLNPILRDCQASANETPLPDQYKPLRLTMEMDQAWEDIVKRNINVTGGSKQDKKEST